MRPTRLILLAVIVLAGLGRPAWAEDPAHRKLAEHYAPVVFQETRSAVLDAIGRRWIVVCLINHPKVHNGNAYPIFDSILQWAHSRGGTLPQYSPDSPPPPPAD